MAGRQERTDTMGALVDAVNLAEMVKDALNSNADSGLDST